LPQLNAGAQLQHGGQKSAGGNAVFQHHTTGRNRRRKVHAGKHNGQLFPGCSRTVQALASCGGAEGGCSAVPTAFLGVTEDEGKKAKELNVKDRKTQRQTVWRNCLAFAKTMLLQPRLPSSESDLAELRISLSVNRKFLWHQSLFCISKSCLKMPVAAVCDDHMDA